MGPVRRRGNRFFIDFIDARGVRRWEIAGADRRLARRILEQREAEAVMGQWSCLLGCKKRLRGWSPSGFGAPVVERTEETWFAGVCGWRVLVGSDHFKILILLGRAGRI
jgi:hypothetical protein